MSRTMIAALQVSLDGFIQASDQGEPEWVDSWADALELIPDVDAFVLGAGMFPPYGQHWESTYHDPQRIAPFATRVPSKREIAYAQLAARTPHYVVSRTLDSVSWPPTARIVRDIEELRAFKAEAGKNTYVVGGGTLVANLLNAGLLDELRLIVHPILLGGGMRLFAGVTQRRLLSFVKSEPTRAGRVVLTYRTQT